MNTLTILILKLFLSIRAFYCPVCLVQNFCPFCFVNTHPRMCSSILEREEEREKRGERESINMRDVREKH